VQQPNDISARRKRLPPPRVVRGEPSHLEDGDSHLWAVSYSDLLMVLMSFFVIYFSFDDSSSAKTGILNIAKSMKGEVVAGSSADAGTMKNGHDGGVGSYAKGTNESFRKRLEELNVKVETPGSALMLNLDSDIFALGQFELNDQTQTQLKEILKIVEPYKNEIEIVVIGHSDTKHIGRKNNYLTNNFDLSSLRALKALQFVIDQGFPSEQISAQGAGENARNSRSISLKIQLRGKTT
jgi:flagellar motor protein MotB